jgi:hypothetical protein
VTRNPVPPNDVADVHCVAAFAFVVDGTVRDATISGPRLDGPGPALDEAAAILAETFGRVGATATGRVTLPRLRVEGRILISGSCHWIARRDDDYDGSLEPLLPHVARAIAELVRRPSALRVVGHVRSERRPASLTTRLLRRSVEP